MTRGSYKPWLVQKVALHSLPSFIQMSLKLHRMSNFVNYLALQSFTISSGIKGERVLILHSHGVQRAVVLHQTEFAVLLFHKEDQSGHRGLGGSDLSKLKILLQKGM